MNLSMHTSSQQGRETYAKNVCKERVEERGILCFRMCSKSHQLNQTLKFLTLHHLLFSVDFRVYLKGDVYTPNASKSMKHLGSIYFTWNSQFSICVHRVRYFKTLFDFSLNKSSLIRLYLITEIDNGHTSITDVLLYLRKIYLF